MSSRIIVKTESACYYAAAYDPTSFSDLEGHPTPRLPWVDVATGSLGQGLCAGVGIALNARRIDSDYRTYVLMGDGETAEGSVWEAAHVAGGTYNALLLTVAGLTLVLSSCKPVGPNYKRPAPPVAQAFREPMPEGWKEATPADATTVTTKKTALDTALDTARKAVSDGLWLTIQDFLTAGDKKGLFALDQADLFNLLCIPPYHAPADALDVDVNLVTAAAAYCERRRAMLLVDAPKDWTDKDKARNKFNDANSDNVGARSRNERRNWRFFRRRLKSWKRRRRKARTCRGTGP